MTADGARNLRVVGGPAAGSEDLVGAYLRTLGGRSPSTVEAYGRVLRQLAVWVAERPGGSDGFRPELLTRTAVEGFLSELPEQGGRQKRRLRVPGSLLQPKEAALLARLHESRRLRRHHEGRSRRGVVKKRPPNRCNSRSLIIRAIGFLCATLPVPVDQDTLLDVLVCPR